MKVLFSGATICDADTMKRLALIADEIGFMDRPSVTFKNWGTIGTDSEIRRFNTSGSPVAFSAHSPPSGPVTELYQRYIQADLANPLFVATFLEGFAMEDRFARKFIQEQANYGSGTGREVRTALVVDDDLVSVSLLDTAPTNRMFQFATREERREILKILLIEASVHVTNALMISERTGLLPVADDLYMCRLLGLRTSGRPYVGSTPRVAPALGIAVAKAVIPDEALAQLRISDIFRYRESTKEAYRAWSVEIDRLAAQIVDLDPEHVERELPRIVNTDVKPRLVEYQNEMRAARDRLFAELIKKVAKWEVPALYLAYLASVDLSSAIALFASALTPAIPGVVDYYRQKRDVRRRNSMAYLIGLVPAGADDG